MTAGDSQAAAVRLFDFQYPTSHLPHGVIDAGMPVEILTDIAASAAALGSSLTGHEDLGGLDLHRYVVDGVASFRGRCHD
jgi:hypothetical protein